MGKNAVKPGLTRKRRARRRSSRRISRIAAVLLRFVTGRPLDGRRHSNCTFWQPGTRRLGVPAYLLTWRWWALAAGWQRAGLRLTTIAVFVLALAGVAR